jgi:hypothetical protein
MDEVYQLDLALLNKKGQVKKAPYYLTVIRKGIFSVSVDQVPLTEYYVLFDHQDKSQQIKIKVYKTPDGKWYDAAFSEEAELNSPEFGIPEINNAVKQAIDNHEAAAVSAKSYL